MINNIKISEDTERMLNIIKMCEQICYEIEEMVNQFNMTNENKNKLTDNFTAHIMKVRNYVNSYMGMTIYENFTNSNGKEI